MNPVSFTAIDLETATSDRSSICEIGIAVVENSEIVEKRSWLVRPENNEYDIFNIFIHGITPSMTEDCEDFSIIWKEVEPYLSNKVVVAHNVSFDMYALKEAFDKYGITYPNFIFYCSYRISTYLLNSIKGYSLAALCESYGIERENEHRALDDSVACAKIFMKCLAESGVESFNELEKKYHFKHGVFEKDYFVSQRSVQSSVKAKDIIGDTSKIDQDSLFYGKNICFTGTLKFLSRHGAMQVVADIGGIPSNSVTRKTDILVVGQQDKRIVGDDGLSGKQEKAIKLIKKGYKIEIMEEADFIKNISSKDISDINIDFAKDVLGLKN